MWVLIWRGYWGKQKYEGIDEEGCRIFREKASALREARRMTDCPKGDLDLAMRELDDMGECAFPDGERLNLWAAEPEE